jgi:hypothetical protein
MEPAKRNSLGNILIVLGMVSLFLFFFFTLYIYGVVNPRPWVVSDFLHLVFSLALIGIGIFLKPKNMSDKVLKSESRRRNTKYWLIFTQVLLLLGVYWGFFESDFHGSVRAVRNRVVFDAKANAPYLLSFVAASALAWFLYVKEKYDAARILSTVTVVLFYLLSAILFS